MKRINKLTDQDLVELFLDGDIAAFEELYNRYWAKLYSEAFKRIRVREASEEIVQDFFTSLWTNRAKLNIHTSFQNYMYNSVRYMVFAYFSKQDSRKKYEAFLSAGSASHDNSTEDVVNLNDLERSLNKQLDHLPDKCRSVFELSRKQYKTNKEIAAALGISEKTVENHLTKALRILRVSLKYVNILLLIISSGL